MLLCWDEGPGRWISQGRDGPRDPRVVITGKRWALSSPPPKEGKWGLHLGWVIWHLSGGRGRHTSREPPASRAALPGIQSQPSGGSLKGRGGGPKTRETAEAEPAQVEPGEATKLAGREQKEWGRCCHPPGGEGGGRENWLRRHHLAWGWNGGGHSCHLDSAWRWTPSPSSGGGIVPSAAIGRKGQAPLDLPNLDSPSPLRCPPIIYLFTCHIYVPPISKRSDWEADNKAKSNKGIQTIINIIIKKLQKA